MKKEKREKKRKRRKKEWNRERETKGKKEYKNEHSNPCRTHTDKKKKVKTKPLSLSSAHLPEKNRRLFLLLQRPCITFIFGNTRDISGALCNTSLGLIQKHSALPTLGHQTLCNTRSEEVVFVSLFFFFVDLRLVATKHVQNRNTKGSNTRYSVRLRVQCVYFQTYTHTHLHLHLHTFIT